MSIPDSNNPPVANDGLGVQGAIPLHSIDDLLPVVYEQLHDLAGAVIQKHRPFDPTRTTSLINDVYVRLASRGVKFKDRGHFLCLAARAMRMVLIDRARRNGAAKRGGGSRTISGDWAATPAIDGAELLAVDETITRLSQFDELKSRIIELRFFGGLTVEEIAEHTKVSPATVKREWTVARAWLVREVDGRIPENT